MSEAQKLRYVAVSRATDTVTIIDKKSNIKSEDSPLNHISAQSTNTQPATTESTHVNTSERGAINTEKSRSVNGTINITQNASGRLGTLDEADMKAYNSSKRTLLNPDASEEQIQQAEQSIEEIYQRKESEMQTIFQEITSITGATIGIEKAAGAWEGEGEYSFKVKVSADSQEQYDRAIQAISYVAEAARQDAFIENLGEVDRSEVTSDGLLKGEYTPFEFIPFAKPLSQREMTAIEELFTNTKLSEKELKNLEITEDIPLDVTITKEGISFALPTWRLGENASYEEYKTLFKNWHKKIENIYKDGTERKLSGLGGQSVQRTFQKSRFRAANDRSSSEEQTRSYSSFRNNYLSERGISKESEGILSEQEGQRVKQTVEQLLQQSKQPAITPIGENTSSTGSEFANSSQTTQQSTSPEEFIANAELYSGAAKGADTVWGNAARKYGIKVKDFTVANWDALSLYIEIDAGITISW
ncbi:MAG: hypothetical protein IJ626_00375 [Muribaculaceae bacterium]|nr:hypothetical protein [Muribaculaceae bacterium]